MKVFDKFKEYIHNSGYKKIAYNLLAIVIICTIALIGWDTFSLTLLEESTTSKETSDSTQEDAWKGNYQDSAEVQLEKILGEIKGVGEVDVMITYESSTEVVPALNVTKSSQLTEEKDAQGGSRSTTQDDSSQNVVMTNQNDQLIIIKEIKPQIRGVVVVAQGAWDIKVKTELIEAVRTIFQIPTIKIMVYEKK
ncbi:sporulation stage III protein AG [Marinisporobacter balticus]|uniref:Stage III sporulation protein AG n=1 Tax=Marinisporobacter balticus TaxID=2018667 RepID=A0A4R2L8Y5_9FIRM|nr:sporulation stage III protein AG [Marinisporobacter balticus]TCO79188.1 stage III sporulation protein AG [Marinisporobacter balticus]